MMYDDRLCPQCETPAGDLTFIDKGSPTDDIFLCGCGNRFTLTEAIHKNEPTHYPDPFKIEKQ